MHRNGTGPIDLPAQDRINHLWEKSHIGWRVLESIAGLAVIAADFDGKIIAYNEGAYLAYGHTPEEAVGLKNIEEFFPKDIVESGKLQEIIDNLFSTGRYAFEGEKIRKNGEVFPAGIHFSLVRDEYGKLLGFVEVVEDISERKLAERKIALLNQELRHRSSELETANKELEAFSYHASHDLRAPLRIIESFSRELLDKYSEGLPEEGRELLQLVHESSTQMTQLIEDLLSLSYVTKTELLRATVDLSEMAYGLAAKLERSQPKRKVDFIIAPGMTVEGDAGLLRIMLDNLMENAWKYTSRQSWAQIEVGKLQDSGGGFFVRDNGAGFNMARAEKLFLPFKRLHGMSEFPGTGIGLSIVQRIVVRHGGRIWAEGAVGRGATFYFVLE